MAWLWSIVTTVLGWWIGHRQSMEDRKRGSEEGAQAAFNIELALVGVLMERDRQRLKEAFKTVDLGDPKQVREVAQVAGEIYAEIIRRDAFHDARVGNISQHDRESWQSAFDQEMPPVSYEQGYLQGIRDILKGASEIASACLDPVELVRFETWSKSERNLGSLGSTETRLVGISCNFAGYETL